MNSELLRNVLESISHEPDRLIGLILQQARRITELTDKLDKSTHRVEHLQEQLHQAQKEARRQAAPFRRPEHKRCSSPRRPGRKPGHRGSYLKAPHRHPDESIDQPLQSCPICARDLSGQPQHAIIQNILEIPKVSPRFIRLTTYQCDCPRCGQSVRSQHPLKVSEATGAAGTHLGPRALAVASTLNKDMGLTMRKTCRVLEELFGLSLTPGGLSHALHRIARRMQPDYATLKDQLRHSEVVHVDETSWWMGGTSWWLHVFATNHATLYRLADNRSREVLHNILGKDFPGVLVSDCLNIYDDATPLQHKCYCHHYQAISKAMKLHPLNGQGFLAECRCLLDGARALKKAKPSMPAEAFARNRKLLDELTSDLLEEPRDIPCEEAIRKRLAKQADHLFTFLDYDFVDATNNLAERQLRPAVIARKLSCGNKTERGANTWQVLSSLGATCRQRGQPFLDTVAAAMPILSR